MHLFPVGFTSAAGPGQDIAFQGSAFKTQTLENQVVLLLKMPTNAEGDVGSTADLLPSEPHWPVRLRVHGRIACSVHQHTSF